MPAGTAPFVVFAERRVKPGKLDAFLEADDALMRDAAQADGFGAIYVVQVNEAPETVCHFELWRDQAAHDAYVMDSAHAGFEETIAELVEHVAEPRHFSVFKSYGKEGPGGGPQQSWHKVFQPPAFDTPRLPPATDDELGEEERDLLDSLPDLTFFRIAARLGAAFPPFMDIADRLMHHGKMDDRLREIAVIAIARLEGARYEAVQHGAVAQDVGVTAEQVRVIAAGDFEAPILNEDERLILRFTREWWGKGIVSDETFGVAQTRFGQDQVTELLLVLGFYLTSARMMTNSGIAPEDPPGEELKTS